MSGLTPHHFKSFNVEEKLAEIYIMVSNFVFVVGYYPNQYRLSLWLFIRDGVGNNYAENYGPLFLF